MGVQLFSLDEGREDPNTTKSRPYYWPASGKPFYGVLLAGEWWPNIECWLGSFVVFQGIRTSIAKKPYIFVIFQDPDPLPPPPPSRFVHVMTCAHSKGSDQAGNCQEWSVVTVCKIPWVINYILSVWGRLWSHLIDAGIFLGLIWGQLSTPSQFKNEQKLPKMVYISFPIS